MAKHLVLAIAIALAACATPRATVSPTTTRPTFVRVVRARATAPRLDVLELPQAPLAEVVETGYPDPCARSARGPIDDRPKPEQPTPLALLVEPCKRTVFPSF